MIYKTPPTAWIPRLLRWPLRVYSTLLLFILASLLGNILVVPFEQDKAQWGKAARMQVASLLNAVQTYPGWSAAIGASVLIL
ncbi:MAG TPA: hypothetical protein VJR48_08235, partial [Ktedonobacterales bacterium]|nr:hypothetical protein [Ktedonobacterales bacterium]